MRWRTPSTTPLCWKAQGMVTVPLPTIAFQVLNTIMIELILEFVDVLASLSRGVHPIVKNEKSVKIRVPSPQIMM